GASRTNVALLFVRLIGGRGVNLIFDDQVRTAHPFAVRFNGPDCFCREPDFWPFIFHEYHPLFGGASLSAERSLFFLT
ncbi:MAG: hypothetical protein WCE26_22000, partial [Candidatus Acidiferrales bacterium]